jgi:hypothetical protein
LVWPQFFGGTRLIDANMTDPLILTITEAKKALCYSYKSDNKKLMIPLVCGLHRLILDRFNNTPTRSPTPRIRRARRTYALRLAQSGKINLNKNLAWGVACMRLLGGHLPQSRPEMNP